MFFVRITFCVATIWGLVGCKPLHNETVELKSLQLANTTSLVTQSCAITDDSPISDSHRLTIEVSQRSQIFRLVQVGENTEVNVVVTDDGITAFDFVETGITGVNVPRAKAESLREILELANQYKRFNPVAKDIVARNTIGPENASLEIEGDATINISLGFDIKNGKLDSSFYWQASTPSVHQYSGGKGIIPSESTNLRMSSPPYKLRFFSEMEESQTLSESWFVKDFYPREISWSVGVEQDSFKRSLTCTSPEVVTDLIRFKEHNRIRNKIKLAMNEEPILSEVEEISNIELIESTLDHYAQVSGMSLVDGKDYEWTPQNFESLKQQFIKGSLAGACLRFHRDVEDQVSEVMCEDKVVKEVFSLASSREKFIESLQKRLGYLVDSYRLPEAISLAMKKDQKAIQEEYNAYKHEVCIKPLELIFKRYRSQQCDAI